ncbi:MAG: hypothetical protein NO515_03240 [Candidatus Methanomethylicia archaeon]|jgi:hypothetical protein|nr:hypothetical protein [Candidatus Methanomethylicia archaeon]
MAEKHVAETKEMVDTILKNLKKYEGWCSCSNHTRTFLPKFSVKQTDNAFEIKVWYVCSTCGGEK